MIGAIIFFGAIGLIYFLWSDHAKTNAPTQCGKCHQFFPKRQIYRSLCPTCRKTWDECSLCDKLFRKTELRSYSYGSYCPSCLQKRFKEECDSIQYGRTHKVVSTRNDYEQHLHSEYWHTIREIALAKANYKCSRCGATRGLHGHHLTYKNLGNERIEDIKILCDLCHEKEHAQNDSTRDWTGFPSNRSSIRKTQTSKSRTSFEIPDMCEVCLSTTGLVPYQTSYGKAVFLCPKHEHVRTSMLQKKFDEYLWLVEKANEAYSKSTKEFTRFVMKIIKHTGFDDFWCNWIDGAGYEDVVKEIKADPDWESKVTLPPPGQKKKKPSQAAIKNEAERVLATTVGSKAPRRVKIIDSNNIYTTINRTDALSWPNEDLKRLAGESNWHGWWPRNGMTGQIIHEASFIPGKEKVNIYIIEVDNHFVPIAPVAVVNI